ncbi:hypothetical protein [Oryzibacter oryziterrae]|uniref:hypothetical protein n=1 Tax=Oryzibacter oryziterrae TaxID=2766474 RepID=UPI001F1E281C|nr:hypothetical protein [Oryzibacter oryziterrae]
MRHVLAILYLLLAVITGYLSIFSMMAYDSPYAHGFGPAYFVASAMSIPAAFFIGAIAIYATESPVKRVLVLLPLIAIAQLCLCVLIAPSFT